MLLTESVESSQHNKQRRSSKCTEEVQTENEAIDRTGDRGTLYGWRIHSRSNLPTPCGLWSSRGRARHKPGVCYLHSFAGAMCDGSRWSKNKDTGPMSGERRQVRLVIKKSICAFRALLAYCRPWVLRNLVQNYDSSEGKMKSLSLPHWPKNVFLSLSS